MNMQTIPGVDASASTTTAGRARRGRLVTDAPMRMFHWLFALSFAGAWLTSDSEHWRALHVTLGYTFAGLLVARVVYGLVGPRQVRLTQWWRRVAGAPVWLRSLARSHALAGIHWQQGQNLLMAAVVLGLLLLAAPLALSGYATYAEWGGEWLEEVHEFFANSALTLVLLHLTLLLLLSLLRRKNQALPMLSGRIEGPGPDLVRHERRWLAALLLLAVLAFGTWQWQQSPHGLLPGGAGGHAQQHDDD